MVVFPANRTRTRFLSLSQLLALLAVGCEQVIGADFEEFSVLHDATAMEGRDSTPPDSSSENGVGDGAANADGNSPPTDGGGSRCTQGEVNDITNCTNCGRYVQICNEGGVWDPPFCLQPPGACAPGSVERQSCEGDGTQTATCAPNCTWMLSGCLHSTCMPNQTEKQPCGACGTQSRTCQASDGGFRWSPFSSCMDEKSCTPDQLDRESCGRCGTHSRVCSAQCSWGSWDSCQNEGECTPGDTQERGCLIGLLKQTRTCSERCAWGDWIGLCL